MRALSWQTALAGAFLACSGSATVDSFTGTAASTGSSQSTGQGAGSTSSASSGSGGGATTTTSSTGSGVDCKKLKDDFTAALRAATKCNACQDFDPCPKGPKLKDACGCDVGSNGNMEAVANATKTYDAWTKSCNGPDKCGAPCPSPGTIWSCKSTMNSCEGRCSP